MKRINFLATFVVFSSMVALFSSCSKSDISFDLPFTITNITYGPHGIGASNNGIYAASYDTSKIDSVVRAYGGTLANLKEIKLKSFSVKLVSPAGGNFNQFDSTNNATYGAGASVYLKNSSADSIKVAYKNPFPSNVDSVSFDNNYSPLLAYLNSGHFTLTYSAAFNSAIPAETITAYMVVTVTIKGH